MDQVIDALVALLLTMGTAAVPILGAKLHSYLSERMSASAIDRLGAAAARAAGMVVAQIAAQPGMSAEAREQQIMGAGMRVASTMAETVARQGGTTGEITAMVRGELGKLIALPVPVAAQMSPMAATLVEGRV